MRLLHGVLATVLCCSGPAVADPPAEKSPLPEPVAPADPVLRTTGERHWTLSLRLETYSDERFIERDFLNPHGTPTPRIVARRSALYDLGRAAIVFPILEGTATSETIDRGVRGSLRFDTEIVDEEPELLPGYQAGERLSRWDAAGVANANAMRLWIDVPMLARSVAFDPARAFAIDWPEGPWPAICASALLPQLSVNPESDLVEAFVLETLGPKPYDDPPALVAKKLAAASIDRFQPSGLGFEYNRNGFFAGIELGKESDVADRLIGSPADMVAMLCAAMRSAGLPARLVIGYDLFAAPEAESESLSYLPDHCGLRFEKGDELSLPRLHYWLEFALYDEANQTLEWIPVDVLKQRAVSSKPPPLDQEWLFFGNHPCAEALLPISHHFFPPTTVIGAGAPLMWGWMATPAVPDVSQTLRAWGSGTPVTTGQEPVFPEE
jgi:hypothetical protein